MVLSKRTVSGRPDYDFLFQQILKASGRQPHDACVFACGPERLVLAVQRHASSLGIHVHKARARVTPHWFALTDGACVRAGGILPVISGTTAAAIACKNNLNHID